MLSGAKLMLAASGLLGATAICSICLPDVAAGARPLAVSATSDTATVKLSIQGMTCGGCATTARIVLQRAEGVYKADVWYESKSAVVQYDPAKTTPEALIAHLRKLTGYEASVIPEPAALELGG